MLTKLSIKAKLIGAFGGAMLGILVLSINGNLALKKNMEISREVKEKKFSMALLMEKAAFKSRLMISLIESSAAMATEDDLLLAQKEKEEVLNLLQKVGDLDGGKFFTENFKRLTGLIGDIHDLGAKRVALVIDQEFEEIPGAAKAFNEKSEAYLKLISRVQTLARQNLEAALDELVVESAGSAYTGLIATCIAVPIIFLCFLLVYSAISTPINGLVKLLEKLASGDLTVRGDIRNQDEIGRLTESVNAFVDGLKGNLRQISESSRQLNASSSNLSAISSRLSSGAVELTGKSTAATTAAEGMIGRIDAITTTVNDSSDSVSAVAAAAEEMTAGVNEIIQNTKKAHEITSEAVSRAKGASEKVHELGSAAREIGKVTEAITEISDQTNLLALNATIEAARAGEAGKGFAVVANEIKELARQTARATDEIKGRISGIQDSTDGTVSRIERISGAIDKVSEMVSIITMDVEGQGDNINEIADNASRTAMGIQEMADNFDRTSAASGEMVRDVTEFGRASDQMSASGSDLNTSAEELGRLSGQLNEMVGKFRI